MLPVLDIRLEFLDGGGVRCSVVCSEHLDIPGFPSVDVQLEDFWTHSSVNGAISFASGSSSLKVLLYFSQFWPLADGMMRFLPDYRGVNVLMISKMTEKACLRQVKQVPELVGPLVTGTGVVRSEQQ